MDNSTSQDLFYQEKSTFPFYTSLIIFLFSVFPLTVIVLYKNLSTNLLYVVPFAIFLLFISVATKLTIRVDFNGITHSCSPFVSKKLLTWDEIEYIKIMKYNPFFDVSRGVKYSFKFGKTRTTRGNIAAWITLKNKNKYFITVIDPESMQKSIDVFSEKNKKL